MSTRVPALRRVPLAIAEGHMMILSIAERTLGRLA